MALKYRFIEKILTAESVEVIPFSPAFVERTIQSNTLATLFIENGRTLSNKVQHGYHEVYSYLFEPLRDSKLNIVELGIGSIKESTPSTMFHYHMNVPHCRGLQYFPGGSLRLWQRYFRNQANKYYGWDIDIDDAIVENAELITVDTTNKKSIRNTLARTLSSANNKENDCIDIFIDDGLHEYESQISVFTAVFPRIRRGGYYIIEDTGVPFHSYDNSTGLFLESDLQQFLLAKEISRICGLKPWLYQFFENDALAGMIVVRRN